MSLLGGETTAVVLTTDYYGTTGLSSIDIKDLEVTETDVGPTNGDDVVRYYDGKLFVLNRLGYDRIDVFDAVEYSYIFNFSTGEGSNPQDIVFLTSEKAYVSCYDLTTMLIVNPSTGEHLGSIDLSEFADADGIPEMQKMMAMTFLGMKRVYVNVQRLDRENFLIPTDKSFLVEINADTDEVLHGIELLGKNPVTTPFLDGYYVVVSCVGSWMNTSDGGVERVHLFTNEAVEILLSEEDAGGNIITYDCYPRRTGFLGMVCMFLEEHFQLSLGERKEIVLMSDEGWNTHLLLRSFKDDNVDVMYDTEGYLLPDMTVSKEGQVFLCDRSEDASGVHVFDALSGDKITNDPLETGSLLPATITLF
jgi:hypothetical protein